MSDPGMKKGTEKGDGPVPSSKSVQKKQAFEMMSEHGKKICRAKRVGRCPPDP